MQSVVWNGGVHDRVTGASLATPLTPALQVLQTVKERFGIKSGDQISPYKMKIKLHVENSRLLS